MNVGDLADVLGDKAVCESCRLNFRLTSNAYIVCAECPKEAGRICLCVKCFANGVEFGTHLRTHKYYVVPRIGNEFRGRQLSTSTGFAGSSPANPRQREYQEPYPSKSPRFPGGIPPVGGGTVPHLRLKLNKREIVGLMGVIGGAGTSEKHPLHLERIIQQCANIGGANLRHISEGQVEKCINNISNYFNSTMQQKSTSSPSPTPRDSDADAVTTGDHSPAASDTNSFPAPSSPDGKFNSPSPEPDPATNQASLTVLPHLAGGRGKLKEIPDINEFLKCSVYRDEFENDWNPDAESLIAELISANQTDKLPNMNDPETERHGRIMMAYHQLVTERERRKNILVHPHDRPSFMYNVGANFAEYQSTCKRRKTEEKLIFERLKIFAPAIDETADEVLSRMATGLSREFKLQKELDMRTDRRLKGCGDEKDYQRYLQVEKVRRDTMKRCNANTAYVYTDNATLSRSQMMPLDGGSASSTWTAGSLPHYEELPTADRAKCESLGVAPMHFEAVQALLTDIVQRMPEGSPRLRPEDVIDLIDDRIIGAISRQHQNAWHRVDAEHLKRIRKKKQDLVVHILHRLYSPKPP
ncbi:hypothetical protein FOL47_008173 [Perkinsus chesapeaki]|uniref:Transcriptional adapter 2-alpha n=1 Tax=Perkinsus chesapeaki TaxID=330153 RepID=A0A7J6MUR3_PERCH|nr:hypothetical protein FOL47_008173 [Perkinsus chesapeaki]